MSARSGEPAAAPKDIAKEMRRVGVLEVDISDRRRAEYSTDASNYRLTPAAVVFPRSCDEIADVFEVCDRLQTPLTMRGAGTSIAGNAIGSGVVVDCSRHLTRIGAVDPAAQTVDVEPGVVLDDLQRRLAGQGLRFGPEPSTHSRATIGGMIGNNACGSRALRYGRTSDNVLGLEVVTGLGERLRLDGDLKAEGIRTLAALHGLVDQNLATIRTHSGRFGRQASGYALEQLLPEAGHDVARFLVGTEGTLALTLGATLRVTAVPRQALLFVLGYRDMAAAADDILKVLAYDPIAVEGMDARIVDVVRRSGAGVPPLPRGGGWLFVELGGDDRDVVADTGAMMLDSVGTDDYRVIEDDSEAKRLWRIREQGAGLASRPSRDYVAHAGWEDAAVPPERLGDYLREFEDLVAEHGLIGYPYGHIGDGCIHVRLSFALGDDDGVGRFRSFMLDAADLVVRYGGSLSGEHGDGRARSELLPKMYPPEVLELFAAVKLLFDPRDLLNPGVIVRPKPLYADLRINTTWRAPKQLAFAYPDDRNGLVGAVHRCSGVGACRATKIDGDDVMCPSYLATRDEKDSTRGRARVLQEAVRADGTLTWRSPAVKDALDLCLACKGCSSDCPTGTDMARYKSEALHLAYRWRPRPLSHYALGRLPTWARLASHAPRLVNATMASRVGALAQRVGGIDTRRHLPAFADTTFSSWFRTRPTGLPGEPVLLWVDTFTENFDPQIGIDAVTVLEDAGYTVTVPRRQLCCALPLASTGQLDRARKVVRRTVRALRNAGSDTMPVVGLEPSCVAMLRGDAADLLGDSAEPVPEVLTMLELLARTQRYEPDLTGTAILAQPHCHHRAVLDWDADRRYLEARGATVTSVSGCCGLAGNFGMEKGHYEVSMAVAAVALAPALLNRSPSERVVADGFSCRLQIEELGSEVVHTVQLLARRHDA